MKKLTIILILFSQVSFAQNITMEEKQQTIYKVSELISKHYVLIDTGEIMIDKIMTNLNEGIYDTISSHEGFANRLNNDLRSVYFDKHMGIYYKNAIRNEKRAWLRGLKNNKQLEWTILDKNIGYLDINTFMHHDPKGKKIIDNALTDLIQVDAIIIDVRDNYGGNGNMSNYLVGQFMPSKTLISTVHKRKNKQLKPVRRYFSKGKIPRFQNNEVPIYVLVNGKTASAGESLAYGLRSFNRATIVGEKSEGAAHANVEKSLNKSFLMLLPNEKILYEQTSKDFESTGVLPDLSISSKQALEFTLKQILNNP